MYFFVVPKVVALSNLYWFFRYFTSEFVFSGQKQENPLLLLGQYSDDELDEEASKQPKPAVEESSSVNMDGQVIASLHFPFTFCNMESTGDSFD